MARELSGRSGLKVIHVLAHGCSGEVNFAAGVLSAENVRQYDDFFRLIG
jgi:hypothetical protein